MQAYLNLDVHAYIKTLLLQMQSATALKLKSRYHCRADLLWAFSCPQPGSGWPFPVVICFQMACMIMIDLQSTDAAG